MPWACIYKHCKRDFEKAESLCRLDVTYLQLYSIVQKTPELQSEVHNRVMWLTFFQTDGEQRYPDLSNYFVQSQQVQSMELMDNIDFWRWVSNIEKSVDS